MESIDESDHDIDLYYDNTAEIAVNEKLEEVVWNRVAIDGMVAMRVGTNAQDILGKANCLLSLG